MASFSLRGILQTLFEPPGSPLDSDHDSEHSNSSSASESRSQTRSARNSGSTPRPRATSRTNSRSRGEDSLPYSPSRLDGEYNVWFARKPLGLGLVPSTQLYGTWEVSTVAPPAQDDDNDNDNDGAVVKSPAHDERAERKKISTGDVLVAVNFSTTKAQLNRDAFAKYLRRSACPIVVTLRKPDVYGSFDSRSLATAMFPTSIEYAAHDRDGTTFPARASSVQWKRNLQHELSTKATRKQQTKSPSSHLLRGQDKPSDARTAARTARSPGTPPEPMPEQDAEVDEDVPRLRKTSIDLTAMGEYSYTFHEVPLHVVLAPSTRLYGSVEVYDPKQHAPVIQIGDVVMAVNGDSTVARWATDEAIQHIAQLEPPATIHFRRPAAYRKYLETYFKAKKAAISSSSVAKSMFPDSAEYRRGLTRHPIAGAGKNRRDSTSPPPKRALEGVTLSKSDWQHISLDLAASDQFKLWTSGRGVGAAISKNQAKSKKVALPPRSVSAFLTERHVHYLWQHLPAYLTCNEMDLVYDTRRHGWNLLSFYSVLEDKGPALLVIKDSRDQIFGAFSSASWKHSPEVYGNGRSFVFTLRPHMRVFPWSGLEQSFMYGRRDAIFMGGGKKGIALCVQLDDLRGFSQACETFDSPPLAQGGNFEIENMEVWCFAGMHV